MCLLAAIAGIWLAGLDNNIFTQIGLVVLIGLAAKNAILIVEFAKQLQDQGKPRFEATIEACRLRLRPILMTSFAFILGVVPLVLAKGAGAEMRTTLGIAVFSGMLGVTIFGISLRRCFTRDHEVCRQEERVQNARAASGRAGQWRRASRRRSRNGTLKPPTDCVRESNSADDSNRRSLETVWFAIVVLMVAIDVVLDGFDFGAGMASMFVTLNDAERVRGLAAIGPV